MTDFTSIERQIQASYKNIEAIAIMKDDELLYQNTYKNPVDSSFSLASVTKSVLSLLIGIAIDQGHIQSLDQSVMDFFPEYRFKTGHASRNSVTLRHLITMTAPFPFPKWNEPLLRLSRQKDWIEYSLGIMGKGNRLGTFKYSTTGAHILSAVLTKATGYSAREYANEFLFKPLEIDPISEHPMTYDMDHVFGKDVRGWVHDPQGYSAGGWGLCLPIDALIKIGQLILHEGFYKEQQIVSSQWIHDSLQENSDDYGYMWWVGDTEHEIMAAGSGGNLIYVNLKMNVIIAIASTIIQKPTDREPLVKAILALI